jgi:phage protein D
MALSEYRLFFDNQPADAARLALIEEIRIDQAIDMISEAQITFPIGRDEGGEWPGVLDSALAPLTRVRVEVSVGDGPFVALIEGRIVAQRFDMGGGPNESQAVIVVHDESAMMNREDKARLFENMPPEAIAALIFAEYGLEPRTEPSGIGASSLERAVMQRGTDFALLRRLARGANMIVHVEPGLVPGLSVGRFRRLPLTPSGLPEMVLTGATRNVNRLTLELDALSPVTARADQVDPASLATLAAASAAAVKVPLGEAPTAALAQPAQIFVDHPGADPTVLAAGVQAAVDRGAWAYSGEGEVSAEAYPAVLQPYQVLSVAGAGSRLSGDYLISEVTHTLRDDGYRQAFTVRRNAHSEVGGGLPGGVF